MKFSLMIFLLLRCMLPITDENPSSLKQALKKAGKNKKELQQVISYYSQNPADSLKLKAAYFLIANMPGHGYWEGTELQQYRQRIDTMQNIPYQVKKDFYTVPYRFWPDHLLCRQIDIETISASYLIDNIESAFRLRDSCSWLFDLRFEDFCEYLLPYRLSDEYPDHWRDSLSSLAKEVRKTICSYDDGKYSIRNATRELRNELNFGKAKLKNEIPDPYIQEYKADCIDLSFANLCVYRGTGIPAATDFIPCFAGLNGSHYWTILIDPRLPDSDPSEINHKTVAKVYRQTYSIQKHLQPAKNEFIPTLLQDPFIRDVTSKYVRTTDITINIPKAKNKIHHAYLAVFNNLKWQAVCGAKNENNEVIFKDMGKDVVYLPVFFDNQKMKNLSYPFILNNLGSREELIPNTKQTQNLRLTRKYPIERIRTHDKFLISTSFECYPDSLYGQPDTIYHIPNPKATEFNTIRISTEKTYRYWQYQNRRYADIAELQFYDSKGQMLSQPKIEGRTENKNECFDGDILSYGSFANIVQFDFGAPVAISEIHILPRNDANGIYPGDLYELFYYGAEGWISLGSKTVSDYFLEYENAPTHCLFWLRNLSRGREERIFTYENGIMRFW